MVVNPLEGLPWVNGIEAWRKELTAELVALPETLRTFREGVSNFQRITKRLLDATEAFETVTALYTGGVADARKRLDEATRAMREQAVDASGSSSERLGSAVEEVTKALAAMADLNPLWRRTHPTNT